MISDFITFLFWSYAPDYFSWKMWEEIGASISVCSFKFFSQIFEQLNWKNWGYNKPVRLLHVWINSTNTVIIVTYSDGAIINRFIASRFFSIIDFRNFPRFPVTIVTWHIKCKTFIPLLGTMYENLTVYYILKWLEHSDENSKWKRKYSIMLL